jgi:hypothetical protein
MAIQTINIGETANDRKGDSLRTAFAKINANFIELYAGGGGGGDLTTIDGGSASSTFGPNDLIIDGGFSSTVFDDDNDNYVEVSGNYVIRVTDGGSITLNTGDSVGHVVITGNLDVRGDIIANSQEGGE